MQWAYDDDAAMIGSDSQAALSWVQSLSSMDMWTRQHVGRFDLQNGTESAWLYLREDNVSVSVQCIMPKDEAIAFGSAMIPAATLYLATPQPSWRMRGNTGFAKRQERLAKQAQARLPRMFDATITWCYAMMEGKKCILARVGEIRDGALVSVVLKPEAPPLDVANIPTKSHWRPLTEWPAGYEQLWLDGESIFGTVGWLGVRAATIHKRRVPAPHGQPYRTSGPPKGKPRSE